MKKVLLASVATLALAAISTTASASVSGTLGGSYANDTSSSGADIWNIDGSLTGMFSGNWGAEVAGSYHNVSGGGSIDIWNIGGSVFWAGTKGRIAATVNYDDFSIPGSDLNFTTYGVGGEWWASPSITVAAKGGGTNASISGCSGCSANGGYAGAMLKGYIMPNLALSGSVDYFDISGGHETDETIRAEWLWSNTMPLSIYGGYQHIDSGLFFGASQDVVFVGLKFYFGGAGGASLVDRQRNGSLGYIGQPTLFWDQY